MAKKGVKKRPPKATRNGANGSFRDGLVRWGVILLVSAWMFLLGVLVGRGTAPVHFEFNSLQNELAALREADIERAERQLRIDAESLGEQPDFEFHEALKETGDSEGIASTETSSSDEGRTPPKRIENKTPLVTKGPLPARAERKPGPPPSEKPAPEKGKPKPPKPEPATVSPGGEGKFTVQVASFRKAEDADRLVAELKRKQYPAYRIAGIIPDKGIWHRVRVGGFDSSAAARAMAQKLKKDRITAFVVSGK